MNEQKVPERMRENNKQRRDRGRTRSKQYAHLHAQTFLDWSLYYTRCVFVDDLWGLARAAWGYTIRPILKGSESLWPRIPNPRWLDTPSILNGFTSKKDTCGLEDIPSLFQVHDIASQQRSGFSVSSFQWWVPLWFRCRLVLESFALYGWTLKGFEAELIFGASGGAASKSPVSFRRKKLMRLAGWVDCKGCSYDSKKVPSVTKFWRPFVPCKTMTGKRHSFQSRLVYWFPFPDQTIM